MKLKGQFKFWMNLTNRNSRLAEFSEADSQVTETWIMAETWLKHGCSSLRLNPSKKQQTISVFICSADLPDSRSLKDNISNHQQTAKPLSIRLLERNLLQVSILQVWTQLLALQWSWKGSKGIALILIARHYFKFLNCRPCILNPFWHNSALHMTDIYIRLQEKQGSVWTLECIFVLPNKKA